MERDFTPARTDGRLGQIIIKGQSVGKSETINPEIFAMILSMTEEELDKAMMRDIQLHEEITMIYVVDGWIVNYSVDDGQTYTPFKGNTPMEALKLAFSEIRNKRGRV